VSVGWRLGYSDHGVVTTLGVDTSQASFARWAKKQHGFRWLKLGRKGFDFLISAASQVEPGFESKARGDSLSGSMRVRPPKYGRNTGRL
jgi:hypothetical protein